MSGPSFGSASRGTGRLVAHLPSRGRARGGTGRRGAGRGPSGDGAHAGRAAAGSGGAGGPSQITKCWRVTTRSVGGGAWEVRQRRRCGGGQGAGATTALTA